MLAGVALADVVGAAGAALVGTDELPVVFARVSPAVFP